MLLFKKLKRLLKIKMERKYKKYVILLFGDPCYPLIAFIPEEEVNYSNLLEQATFAELSAFGDAALYFIKQMDRAKETIHLSNITLSEGMIDEIKEIKEKYIYQMN